MGRFINADAFAVTGQGLLGNNMFAYCGNNSTNNLDTDGLRHEVINPSDISSVGSSGGGWVLWYPLVWLVDTVCAIFGSSTNKDEAKAQSLSMVVSESSPAVYYGADIVGDATGTKVWRIQTGPMDFDTAIAWTYTTASVGKYGKNASWGLYTPNQNEAAQIAVSLGGIGLCLHENRVNEYPHYHVTGMLLFGQYKHFHIWYGSVYTG